jgi:hypothetical protein
MAKAKGTTLISSVKFLRQHRDAARALLPEALHRYLEERVIPTSWYPETDLLELIRATARLVPGAGADVFETMGRITAREHLEGTYAHLVDGKGDPLSIPSRAFALWASQHDSGRITALLEGPDRVRIDVVDFAIPSREMCAVVGGYVVETLRLAGLPAPRGEKLCCRLDGADRCSWRCVWVPAAASEVG